MLKNLPEKIKLMPPDDVAGILAIRNETDSEIQILNDRIKAVQLSQEKKEQDIFRKHIEEPK